jgi:endonuclease YncB( thermonuclease family)
MNRTALALALVVLACRPVGGDRYSRQQAQKSLTKLETPGVVVGEFHITKVVDGDTVWVDGLDKSLRLLGFDAEETFKTEADRRGYEAGADSYMKGKRGTSPRPVKMATPMGEQAKEWAKHFFDGVERVRVERDHPAEIRDRYDRYLAYVIALKNGTWVNYNVEAVRQGMAPYFPKYGYSRRFHADFLAAEGEAKAKQRGIWAPGVAGATGYPDYPEREAWWGARGAFVDAFRKEGGDSKPNWIDITHWDAEKKLEELVGKEVVVLGTVDEVYIGTKGPTRVSLGAHFPIIFFDKDVFGSSGIGTWKGEFVTVTGTPSIYENKHTHKKQVQIVVDQVSQVKLSPVPGLVAPSATPAAEPPQQKGTP